MDLRHDRPAFDKASALAEPAVDISEVGLDRLDLIERLNVDIFDEEHIINTFDRDDLLILVAWTDEEAIGFKIGYRRDENTFYSAKGGVRESYRRQGVARALLYAMVEVASNNGYGRFVYDTFPNKHPGMTVMGLEEGFRVIRAGYSPRYEDYRLRFELSLVDS